MADDPFYVGFAISVWQNSGDANTNWGDFENQRTFLGHPRINNNDKCGVSCDFWNRYEEDIERAYQMGSNCFRISLEWSRIEPSQGFIDHDAVDRYNAIFDSLIDKGMEPFVTLHHFVHPLWFEKLGGFAKEENIAVFVEWAVTAYRLFGDKIKQWVTFNEPGLLSFAGFFHGSFPPGKIARIAGCGSHLLHMCRAHTEAYAAIKAMPGGNRTTIGLVHNYFSFEPKESCCTPFYIKMLAAFLNKMWSNHVVLNYLKTGIFDFNPLFGLFRVYYEEPAGKIPGCDMFGINYYSRGVMDWKLAATCNEGEIMTEMPYALYPEGLIEAIHHFSHLGVPIYITETGVADSGDSVRPIMIKSYMEKIEEAVQQGYDVRGIMYWSLVDNFEWNLGFAPKFGVYAWSPSDTEQKRVMRPSAELLKQWFKDLKIRIPQYRRMGNGVTVSGGKNGVVVEEMAMSR